MSTRDTFTLTAAGDAILNRRLRPFEGEESFRAIVDRIRAADLSVVNLETLLHDHEGYPAANAPGTYMQSPPWVADELTWAGFDAFAVATNHAFDYSHGGMEATMRELETREIPYSGLGRNLARARAPAYVDTPAGRCALVSVCSTIPPGSVAGERGPAVGGRPGIAPLRLDTRYRLPPDAMKRLRETSDALGLEGVKRRRAELGFPIPGHDDDAFRLLNLDGGAHPAFEVGDEFAVERRAREADVAAILDRIADAGRQADWVVVSLHAHEGTQGRSNDHTVPSFIESFARSCIDHGADAFLGHGPHVLRGVEVYRGSPIWYSLGNFLFQNETVEFVPPEMYDRYGLDADDLPAAAFDARVFDDGERTGFLGDRAFWESVLPACTFDPTTKELDSMRLYPLTLGPEKPRPRRGRPLLASGERATAILESIAELSEPYGTDLVIDGDHARVAL